MMDIESLLAEWKMARETEQRHRQATNEAKSKQVNERSESNTDKYLRLYDEWQESISNVERLEDELRNFGYEFN